MLSAAFGPEGEGRGDPASVRDAARRDDGDLHGLSMCIEMIKEKLGTKKPQFLPMNLKAYEAGKALVK